MLFFIFALFILLVSSLPWVAVCRPPNKAAWVMALYLIGSANITLSCYIANSFYVLNQRWIVLLLHMLIGGLGWLIRKYAGKPSLWMPFQDWEIKLSAQWLWREPVLALLTFSMVVCYVFALVKIAHIPQNNMDSLSTHLTRIGFWLQHGSFFPWPTIMLNQVWYPINAQIQTYWTLLFLGGDQLVGSVQWLAALISGVGVFGIARLLAASTRSNPRSRRPPRHLPAPSPSKTSTRRCAVSRSGSTDRAPRTSTTSSVSSRRTSVGPVRVGETRAALRYVALANNPNVSKR